MTDEEFNRAKNLLKCNIFMSLEAQEGRLEETSKNV